MTGFSAKEAVGFALLMTFSRHRSRADRAGHKNVNRGHSWLADLFDTYLG
jgi:hypothetical protein